jgi:hypothetical protein
MRAVPEPTWLTIVCLLFVTKVCLHQEKHAEGAMDSVTVQIPAAEFSATMTAIAEWLDANRYEPVRYKYDHHEDAVLVTVDFTAKMAAEAFAVRFQGIYHLSPHPASPDSARHRSA